MVRKHTYAVVTGTTDSFVFNARGVFFFFCDGFGPAKTDNHANFELLLKPSTCFFSIFLGGGTTLSITIIIACYAVLINLMERNFLSFLFNIAFRILFLIRFSMFSSYGIYYRVDSAKIKDTATSKIE